MAARVDHGITSGTFSLDGETFDVDNNVWVVGDDNECLIIDAPHSVESILKLVNGRKVVAVVLTHAHDDHVRVAPELAGRTEAPLLLHPAEEVLWKLTHPGLPMPAALSDGQEIAVAGTTLTVLHTPGHSPGAICLYAPALSCVFTGDTLFQGGPGATGRSYSDRPTIERSIRDRLLMLPPSTVVHTGHGDDTTIQKEQF
ncbi:MBL fold metallo-hydrolase [Actinoplanes sp. TFC3]|uniref:MBL fold metallo-hydrolase n=1 Tax=Actinoplanes sp. TFC3 TaxID=1710355 RepID=UPI0008346454|nr:MBL fold metallo-hydrolase [Actinoplanes sp. TFC3]